MEKSKTVAFTGHRTAKIIASTKNPNIISDLATRLDKTVASLCDHGYTTFMAGMAEGFDLLAAEAVLRARIHRPEIRFIAVVPFQGQELSYSSRDKERYKIIYELANEVVFTSDYYHDKAYFMRNDYLVAHSPIVVCYYNTGQRSGTMYTVNRAKEQGSQVINLAELAV